MLDYLVTRRFVIAWWLSAAAVLSEWRLLDLPWYWLLLLSVATALGTALICGLILGKLERSRAVWRAR